jgi:hypothetical protein
MIIIQFVVLTRGLKDQVDVTKVEAVEAQEITVISYPARLNEEMFKM